jgi:hypothetical protein
MTKKELESRVYQLELETQCLRSALNLALSKIPSPTSQPYTPVPYTPLPYTPLPYPGDATKRWHGPWNQPPVVT